ncbi:S8 family serine peptidase [Trueperella pyogenes]|uniref:S8 family serine peptidase n=1 Tax=Trueperella pyogenes TaxID=1661 RepID=UPI00345C75BE
MRKKLIAGLAVLALSLGAAPAAAAPDAPPAPPAPPAAATERPEKSVPIIVTLERQPKGSTDKAMVEKIANDLAAKYNMSIRRQFSYLVNAFSAYVPLSAIEDLALEKGVAAVDRMRVYYPSMESAVKLTQVVQASQKHDVDGQGLVVSIVDTGIDINHQDMRLDDGVAVRVKPEAGFTDKVPYGYNFADETTQVKDKTASQHGMHVAGIVAANAPDGADVIKNGRIDGVAPNAQLLAMKVFSNDPKKPGAAADDVMAAVEESVKRGADVINLSLGHPNGHEGQALGEQRVIANARAAGVEVIVAAGNEGQNGSAKGVTDDQLGLLDDGTVGGPSTGTDAWSVASVENSTIVNSAGTAKNDKEEHTFSYQLQVGSSDGSPVEIVDAGWGTMQDTFGKDFSGKFVLIQRGAKEGEEPITFGDKFRNALFAKAAGVIVYNHKQGGDEFLGMGGLEGITIPGAFIGHKDGVKLAEMIKAGKTTIALTNMRVVVANPDSMRPSSFTSWGAGPELGFKPEIAGIGGNVYSTVNDHKYDTKSGTSMAAPHVAGVAALMIQKAEADNPQRPRSETVLRNRVALSNTAKILEKDGVPFAPRQIGAGLVQVQDALETKVLATVDDSPVVALKEVAATKSFTVTLANESDQPRTFSAGATCVVNEEEKPDSKTTTYCSKTDTITASTDEVTVPAGGKTEVTYTLNVSGADHWTQGWVTFEAKDEGQPNLSVPYLGFAGDWNAEPIIDYPRYVGFPKPVLEKVNTPTHTSLYTLINGGQYTFNDGEQFISPNGDGLADVVFARVAMLRNAKRVDISILDDAGKTVREIGSQDEVVRPILKAQLENKPNALQTSFSSIRFNGKVYNPRRASFEDLPDGKYKFRISAKMGEAWPAQHLDMPFGIDRVPPTVKILSSEKNKDGNYVVRVEANDDFSGVNAVQGRFTFPAGLVARADEPQGNVYTLTVPGKVAEAVGYFELYASDRATNVVRQTVMLGGKMLLESDPTLKDLTHIGKYTESEQTGELLVQEGKLVLTGRADREVVKVRAGKTEVTVPDSGRFEIRPPVVEGKNTVTIEALNAAGDVVGAKTYTFVYDPQAPVVTITTPTERADIAAQVAKGTIHVEGSVSDNVDPVTEVDIDGVKYPVEGGKFAADVAVKPDKRNITVRALDRAQNVGVGTIVLALADEATPLRLVANLGFSENFNAVSAENEALRPGDNGTYTFLYAGKFNRLPREFIVAGKPVKVNEDGTFETPVSLKEGITDFNVTIIDTNGKEVANTQVKVLLDLTAPTITMAKPNIHPDGALYLRAAGEVEFAGTVSDNAFGYELAINGDHVEQFLTIEDPGAEINKRDFSKKVAAADGDKILVLLKDHHDNTFAQLIPVIVDAEAPQVSVDVDAGEKFKADQKRMIKVRVEDKNLSDAAVYLDGNLVQARQTVLTPAPGAAIHLEKGTDKVASRPKATVAEKSDTAGTQDAPATDVGDASAEPATVTQPAAPAEPATVLSFDVGPDFEVGAHELLVTAADKAGNTAETAVPFEVVAPDSGHNNDERNPGGEIVVPGINPDDLTDPDANNGWDEWRPGQVNVTGDSQSAQAKPAKSAAKLSNTGATVSGIAVIAGVMLLAGAFMRKRSNAR